MATELGLLSLTHLHKLAQSQDNQNHNQNQDHYQLNPNTLTPTTTTSAAPWMWNPKAHQHHQESDEDSWEVRAFAEDTGNVMGTTWPPRSYTCAFCRREFRSAQALGGHMNVHRRDRARLHQVMPPSNSINNHPAAAVSATGNAASSSSSGGASSFLIPTGEFVSANGGNGGLCLVYQLPNYNAGAFMSSTTNNIPPPTSTIITTTTSNACTDDHHYQHHQSLPSPSTLLSISPYPGGRGPRPMIGSSTTSNYMNTYPQHWVAEAPSDHSANHHDDNNGDNEELDLELRLGHGPTSSN